jgi:hypothetical protein
VSVASVRVPRAILEEALARTTDPGERQDDSGTTVEIHPETKIDHERPELADAIITLIVR